MRLNPDQTVVTVKTSLLFLSKTDVLENNIFTNNSKFVLLTYQENFFICGERNFR